MKTQQTKGYSREQFPEMAEALRKSAATPSQAPHGQAHYESVMDKSAEKARCLPRTSHSPLPWHESAGIITAGANPGQPYISDCRFGPEEQRQSNIKLIMSSVNGYVDLQAHAQRLADALAKLVWVHDTTEDSDFPGLDKAREALAQWEKDKQ